MANWHPCASASAVYQCIEKYYSLEGQSPAIPRIAREVGLVRNTVHYHITALIRHDWLRHEGRKGAHHAYVPIHYPRVYYRRTGE